MCVCCIYSISWVFARSSNQPYDDRLTNLANFLLRMAIHGGRRWSTGRVLWKLKTFPLNSCDRFCSSPGYDFHKNCSFFRLSSMNSMKLIEVMVRMKESSSKGRSLTPSQRCQRDAKKPNYETKRRTDIVQSTKRSKIEIIKSIPLQITPETLGTLFVGSIWWGSRFWYKMVSPLKITSAANWSSQPWLAVKQRLLQKEKLKVQGPKPCLT